MKLYLWEEGLWHKCFNGRWRAGNYTKSEFKCSNCKFTHPYLKIIPFMDRYYPVKLKGTTLEKYDYLNTWYFSHGAVVDMSKFKKERIEIKWKLE